MNKPTKIVVGILLGIAGIIAIVYSYLFLTA